MKPDELLDVLVSDALASCPVAARVFMARGMACVGCPFARFETIAGAAAVYGLDPLDLAGSLAEAGVAMNNVLFPRALQRADP